MKYSIEEFSVSNFRSISNLTIKPKSNDLITICGSNNVGKTNFLRALKLFFNPDIKNFDPKNDIPFHIVEGTRGAGFKTTLKIIIKEIASQEVYKISQVYSEIKKVKTLVITGTRENVELKPNEILSFLEKNFSFFLIEASNINIPKLISEIVNEEILPIGLDTRRGALQQDSLTKLKGFIDKSKEVVSRIENDLTVIFKDLFSSVDTIDSEEWKLKIIFPEYNFLREAIASMINFTLIDTNDRELESKGSGIQRIILLSLIQYVNQKSKKDILWAIDEPEAYLQPSLQKSLYSKFSLESQKNIILIATHSTFFINLNNLKNTFLFEGTKEIKNEYQRAKNKVFYKVNVVINQDLSSFEKAQKIKNHFGIIKNDSWEIMPYNLLVEGQEDKDYLIALLNFYNLPIPNILVAGGVNKYPGYLQFINDYCSELTFKPKIFAIYDKDGTARSEYNSLNSEKKKRNLMNIELLNKFIVRYDGEEFNDIEIEDFMPPDAIIDAANKMLKKRKYSIIKSIDRSKRTQPAYNKKTILQFITEMARLNNVMKNEMVFDSVEMKLGLSRIICNALDSRNETSLHFHAHPIMKNFLLEIIDVHDKNKNNQLVLV